MKNQDQPLHHLYADFLANRLNPDQVDRLKDLFKAGDENSLRKLVADALKDEHSHAAIREDEQERLDAIYMRVKADIKRNRRTHLIKRIDRKLITSIAAAAILAIISVFVFNQRDNEPAVHTDLLAQVQPGSNKAILTLSDGRQFDLSGKKQGHIKDVSGVSATYTTEGAIVYGANPDAKAGYNTIETPNAGEYRIELPDGTKVHLNAGSFLRYPVSFGNLTERSVQLSGEAYFEVAHNKRQPFRVVTATQTVEVLGTHFNINSYVNEGKTITTLEEGSVKVFSRGRQRLLKPGEHAIIEGDGKITVGQADLATEMAWKDGNIVFKDATIRDIMRLVERWYDIRVSYEGPPSNRMFNGGMPRNTRLSVLLEVLKDSDISFRMEQSSNGKRLIIAN